jgi:ABC-type sugar transport system permease subunit
MRPTDDQTRDILIFLGIMIATIVFCIIITILRALWKSRTNYSIFDPNVKPVLRARPESLEIPEAKPLIIPKKRSN